MKGKEHVGGVRNRKSIRHEEMKAVWPFWEGDKQTLRHIGEKIEEVTERKEECQVAVVHRTYGLRS